MPSSSIRSFSDPDEFATSIRAVQAELTLTATGEFAAELVRVDFHDLWIQQLADNLPRVLHTAPTAGRMIFAFPTGWGGLLSWGGLVLPPSAIIIRGVEQQVFQRSEGAAMWGAMSLPLAAIGGLGMALAGRPLVPAQDARLVTSPPSAIARLRRLHAAAADLARTAPKVIADDQAARGLERALVEALVSCLGAGEMPEDAAARRRHEMIMRRFRTFVAAYPDRPLYLLELCEAVGVSARTLNVCCQEHMGISPLSYLRLRRMHLARRELARAEPPERTVTGVATSFGFWELGRFAVAYRRLFGESPSETLRRPSDFAPSAP